MLMGTIPQILPVIHTAYSWYLDLIHTDLTLSSQVSKILDKGVNHIKDLVDVFKTLDATKMNQLLETFNEVKKEYNEITGASENEEKKVESIEK